MNTDSNLLAVSAGLRAALGYYRLVAEIGRGGMASVFLALFPNGDGTSRKVVLKQLHAELAMDDDFRAMFEDEARLATRLHHDNVVETYDIYSDLDLCVLVMEFLDGQTLSRIRQRARRVSNVPLSIHLRVLAEVLAGLHYVHELTDEDGRPLGIVHRDVTPSNVFVTYDGHVKVVDFGIAKATTRIAETRMGVLKGKLAYMSPEAVRGEPVDRRSDIFSVGVMLWEAATGLRLWQDHDEVAIYRRLATGDLPLNPPGAQIANAELFRIAKRALAVDPYQRYDNADEMKQEIEALLVQLGKMTRAPALSAYMESFFSVEREQFQSIVDEALARFPTKPVSQRRLIANELTDSYPALDPGEPPTTVASTSGGTFRTTAYDLPLDAAEVPDFRRRNGFLVAAGTAAVAVSVALMAHAPHGQQAGWLKTVLRRSQETSVSQSPAANAPVANPVVANPVVANPVVANPVVANPVVTNPVVAKSPAAKLSLPNRVVASPTRAPMPAEMPEAAPYDSPEAEAAPASPKPTITAVATARPVQARSAYAAPSPGAAPKPAPQREEPARVRRGKRTLDRDDPWSL